MMYWVSTTIPSWSVALPVGSSFPKRPSTAPMTAGTSCGPTYLRPVGVSGKSEDTWGAGDGNGPMSMGSSLQEVSSVSSTSGNKRNLFMVGSFKVIKYGPCPQYQWD